VSDTTSLLSTVLLPIVGLWLLTTGLTTAAMLHLTRRAEPGGLPQLWPEAWGAVSAAGAAGGGLVGVSAAAPAFSLGGASPDLLPLLLVAAAAMLLGAALTAGLVLLAVWLWTGGA
jgi:hypothetical protein